MIQDNVRRVFSEVNDVCLKAGRDPKEVTIIGVTKTVPIEGIQEAINAGIVHIAENRVQEAESKFPSLLAANPQIKTHIIGHLQSNKAKDVIKVVSLIQSVDSLKLASEIDKQAAKAGMRVLFLSRK